MDEGLHQRTENSTEEFRLCCESQSAIHLAKNAAYPWLWEKVEEKNFVLTKIHTEENGSDMLTKVLSAEKLDTCRKRVGLTKHPMPE